MVESLTQKVAESKYHIEMVSDVQYSPDGSKLATGSHDNMIDIYDVQRGWELSHMQFRLWKYKVKYKIKLHVNINTCMYTTHI